MLSTIKHFNKSAKKQNKYERVFIPCKTHIFLLYYNLDN